MRLRLPVFDRHLHRLGIEERIDAGASWDPRVQYSYQFFVGGRPWWRFDRHEPHRGEPRDHCHDFRYDPVTDRDLHYARSCSVTLEDVIAEATACLSLLDTQRILIWDKWPSIAPVRRW